MASEGVDAARQLLTPPEGEFSMQFWLDREDPPRAVDKEGEVDDVFMGAISPLDDVYCERAVYLWCKLVVDGDKLVAVRCGEEIELFGETWWMTDFEIDTLLPSYDGKLVEWGLEEGISPGQPFLVRVPPPHITTDYYGESDEDWDFDVVRKLPVEPLSAAKAWEHTLKRLERNKARSKKYDDDFRARVLRSFKTWELRETRVSMWDYALTLESRLGGGRHLLAYGAAKDTFESVEAKVQTFALLLKNFRERNPGVSEYRIWALASELKLPVSRSAWEHILDSAFDEYDAQDHP